MSLSYKEVAEILKIIDTSELEELVLELDGTRLVVRRHGATASVERAAPRVEAIHPEAASAVQKPAGWMDSGTSKSAEAVEAGEGVVIRAPMVGSFYTRPSPDDAPFVAVGDRVSSGDRLCLIEVMKLFTSIESTVDGVVESVLAEDGKLVEFDQPLFVIREDG